MAAPRKFTWLAAGGGGLLFFSLLWAASGRVSGGTSVDGSDLRIAQVRRGDLIRDVAAEGRVIAANSPMLYAISGGTVQISVVAGDKVITGQPLARIDSPELLSRLAQERFTLASLEAEAGRAALDALMLRSAARKLRDKAQIDRVAAGRELDRYRRAFDRGAIPQVDLAKAQDELQKADVGVNQADEDLVLQAKATELDTRNKHLLADRQREIVAELKRQVDMLTLRAPFDGQVGQIQVAQGANVSANAPILSVVDLSQFEVEVKVPESFARDLGLGMPAQILNDEGKYGAEVAAVSPEVTGGQVLARLRFANGKQPTGLRQNQHLSARILIGTRHDILMLERGPFLDRDGGGSAYVVRGGSAIRRTIRTGASSISDVEIISGLQLGERVVVSGSDRFGSADRVSIN